MSQTEDNIARKEVPSALRSFFFLYFYLGIMEQLTVAIASWIVAWLALSVFIISRKPGLRSAMIKFAIFFFVIAALFSASFLHKYYDASHQGVIVAEEAGIHSGPDASYTEIFILKNGSEVKVTGKEGSWVKIMVSQEEGSQAGWLESSQIKTIL